MVFIHFQVIKKIMKMDAGKAFNAPVDPVPLGIPVCFAPIRITKASLLHENI
jgi:hypothetical protein